ncbi:MAG: Uma2 family endonuclease [Fimbriimonadales bacterium]|nr:Uma2 family endonuclease [Fimbriimonadales bacterium]
MALTNPPAETEVLDAWQERQLQAIAQLRELLPQYEQSPTPQLRAEIERLTKLLPTEDGIPMENLWHVMQMHLLIELVNNHWRERDDYFVAGNVFVYYSPEQAEGVVRNRQTVYRGPDFFVVTGVEGAKERDSWVVWLEGKYPDLIIEFLSDTTADNDRVVKKRIYQKTFRTREYFWYNAFTGEFVGLELVGDGYQPKTPNERGWYWSEVLGAWVGVHRSAYERRTYNWLRLFDREGNLILTDEEEALEAARLAQQEAQRAEREAQLRAQEAQRAEREAQRAEQERQLREQMQADLERMRQKLREAGLEE